MKFVDNNAMAPYSKAGHIYTRRVSLTAEGTGQNSSFLLESLRRLTEEEAVFFLFCFRGFKAILCLAAEESKQPCEVAGVLNPESR